MTTRLPREAISGARRVVHAPVHQQPVNQDERAVALAVDVVGDAVAAVAEGAVGIGHTAESI